MRTVLKLMVERLGAWTLGPRGNSVFLGPQILGVGLLASEDPGPAFLLIY